MKLTWFCLVSRSATLNIGASLYFNQLCTKPLIFTCRNVTEPMHSTSWDWVTGDCGGDEVMTAASAPCSPTESLQQWAFFLFSPLQQGIGAFLRCQESLLEEHVICHLGVSSTQNASWTTSFWCPVWIHGDNGCAQDKLLGKPELLIIWQV